MSTTEYPACAVSVIVSLPASTTISPAHAPTGTLLDRVSNWNVKEPATPGPSASLQICRRPMGTGVAVGVQFGAQLGVEVAVFVGPGVDVTVEVGKPKTLFVKIASITPLTIRTVTIPWEVFLLTARSGLTSIRET